MAHRDRNEQRALKARKDSKGLAKRTKPHTPKSVYKRQPLNKQEYLQYEAID